MWPFTRKPETTSSDIAALAAKGLAKPWALTMPEVRRVCASALTQAKDKGEKPSAS
jgi:hypothetical protein